MKEETLRSGKLSARGAVVLILLQSMLYGFGDPISKAAFDVMPVYSLISLRYLLALAVLMLFAGKRIIGGLRSCSVRDWLVPSLCMGGGCVTNNIALELAAATSVSFLRSLSTVMTPLMALVLYRRPFSRKHIPIQLLVMVGMYLMCGLGGLSGFGWGEVVALLSALLMAGALVFGEKALDRVDPLSLSACQAASSALLSTICVPIFSGGWHLELVTPQIGAIIAYLAIGSTIGGCFLQNAALGKISARAVALLQCSSPVLTAAFSYIILGERLTLAGMVGAAIILVCVIAEIGISEDAG